MSNSINPDTLDKLSIADLIAEYGSSSATAWLESEQYKIWRPTEDIPQSKFKPVQGYMQKDSYVFAWGNPLVSSPEVLKPTARAFVDYVTTMNLQLVWACVDHNLEEILASNEFSWSVVSCIHEDIINPNRLLELTSSENRGREGARVVKDLKKNLRWAEKSGVCVEEFHAGVNTWSEEDQKVVRDGIQRWREGREGVQIASTTLKPCLDSKHRRYWVARQDGKVVGFLVLTPLRGDSSWQIKNAISFPDAPKGTSETLVYRTVKDLYEEKQDGVYKHHLGSTRNPLTITFGITASDHLKPIHNLGGWWVSVLSKTYGGVASAAGLLKRGAFRVRYSHILFNRLKLYTQVVSP
ncbi:hypothetical protein P691DRAFT_760201 [Macrolepiota fuliginosa MF-IS2]|uniref:Phosphatidylglycerol lysyltransferase C-terminal domain-containing protein n=1 Tax=Macrolepiota fuliginosa MF-IS2 TaxID=1400762 RepID=A0A9P5XEK8_9AGAR|nr:hypothetical protein P691DRAFT_760201 [Macrolepiota fuliginosa MF-IS2]